MGNARTVLIGLGPPRSGTTSLARLLGGCRGVRVTHEHGPRAPWEIDRDAVEEYCTWIDSVDGTICGDVACWHLPAAEPLLRRYGEAIRVPVILRPFRETVASMAAKCRAERYLTGPDSRHDFPHWPGLTDHQAWGAYWTLYVSRALELAGRFPARVRVFGIDCLNSRAGQDCLFDFCGIANEARIYPENCHHNRLLH